MANHVIKFDSTSEGYVAYKGPDQKVAVITTKHHQGMSKEGRAVYEDMDKPSWTIHFTSPQLSLELVEAVLGSFSRMYNQEVQTNTEEEEQPPERPTSTHPRSARSK